MPNHLHDCIGRGGTLCRCCVCEGFCSEESDEIRRMLPRLRALIKRFANVDLDTPIDELIERSSLGDEDARVIRAQADPDAVAKILRRVDELNDCIVHEGDLFADDVIAEAAEALWDVTVPDEAGGLDGQTKDTRVLMENEARSVIEAALYAARCKKTKAKA